MCCGLAAEMEMGAAGAVVVVGLHMEGGWIGVRCRGVLSQRRIALTRDLDLEKRLSRGVVIIFLKKELKKQKSQAPFLSTKDMWHSLPVDSLFCPIKL